MTTFEEAGAAKMTKSEVTQRLKDIVAERRRLYREARTMLHEHAATLTPYALGDEFIETKPNGYERRWKVVEVRDPWVVLDGANEEEAGKPRWWLKLRRVLTNGNLGKAEAGLNDWILSEDRRGLNHWTPCRAAEAIESIQ